MTVTGFTLPSSRLPPPAEAEPLRWAILGPGRIAAEFAGSLRAHTRQHLAAVGSRRTDRAREFAERFGGPGTRAHGSYDAALTDDSVDVVYIAVPHVGHAELALRALEAGKHVLVEKPFAISEVESRAVVDTARRTGLFAAEAMWPRYLPAYDVLRQILADGLLGEIRSVVADLGEFFEPDPADRLFDPALGGGALLDLGVYLAAFSSFFGGAAVDLLARGRRAMTGVDATFSTLSTSRDGVQSNLFCTIEAPTPTRAWVGGTKATLTVEPPFYATPRITVTDVRGACSRSMTFEQTDAATGLAWEAAHVAQCIAEGRRESPFLPLEETVGIARTLDLIEQQLEASRQGR
jgi:predicted dehydrogenase